MGPRISGYSSIICLSLLKVSLADEVDFERQIRPILVNSCVKCHGEEKQQGGLRFDTRLPTIATGESGQVSVVPNQPEKSELIRRVSSRDDQTRMPPKGEPLSSQQVNLLKQWITEGARWPDEPNGSNKTNRREMIVTEDDRSHWAYQPLREVPLPAVKNSDWVRTPVDQFILAGLEQNGLSPSPALSPQKLMRRLYFDIIGLPPIWQIKDGRWKEKWMGVERINDPSQMSAETVLAQVNPLLESPHYGERWGRHWLDVARYADSDGQEADRDRPSAYRYRDFVIRAWNSDMPFDQFVRWQLAGNEYEPENPDAVAATGFLTAGTFAALPDNLMADERLRTRYNELDDIVSTIGTGMLGLTFGCARCHDHKYDAIPARDYYRMLCAFHGGDRTEVSLGSPEQKILAYRDSGPEPMPTWLFLRGDYYDHEHPVSLGFLTVLTRSKSPDEYWREAKDKSPAKNTTLQRRALAGWLTDVENGAGALVARVIVNRVWQHHFGSGLVHTLGDFGVRSERPSHPELLEWLARDLVQHEWKLKRLHRLIVTSAVYQQASAGIRSVSEDPENRLLWKMKPRRLEAEILRDSMLAVSDTLNLEAFGPGFKPPIAAEAMLARNLKDSYPAHVPDSPAVRRRSVYMFHKRVIPNPLLQAFDQPDSLQSCNRRDPTTVTPQALALLNDPFVRAVSLSFADRLLKESGDQATRIERGYRLAVGRSPNEIEQGASKEFLEVQEMSRTSHELQASPDEVRRRSLADWCQILFSLNEFLYID